MKLVSTLTKLVLKVTYCDRMFVVIEKTGYAILNEKSIFSRLVNTLSTALLRKIASLGTLEGPLVKQFYAQVQHLPVSLVAEIDILKRESSHL